MVCDAAIPEGRNSDAVCRSVTFDKSVFVPAEATKSGDLVLLAANITFPQQMRGPAIRYAVMLQACRRHTLGYRRFHKLNTNLLLQGRIALNGFVGPPCLQ